jgi:lipoprotein signal peptidase
MKTLYVIFWTLILIIVDQLIKIIINSYFGQNHFEIIPSLIEFKPTFNDKHSYVNTLLIKYYSLDFGLLPHLILYLFFGIMISVYFFYFRNNIDKNKQLLDISIIFLCALINCALIGNLIWKNGTLDYIYLKPLFVFDLKDAYGNIGIVFFLIYAIKNMEQLKPVKTRDVFLYAKRRFIKEKK